MLAEKPVYTVQDLFDNLPISIRKFSETYKINEVTLARIRDGEATYRSTANRMLNGFSEVYDRILGMHNVTGINILISRKGSGQKEASQEEVSQGDDLKNVA